MLIPEARHVPLEEVRRPTIVAAGPVGQAQIESRLHLQGEVLERAGDGEGALARLDGAVRVAQQPGMAAQIGEDQPQPPLVPESAGETLRFLQVRVRPLRLSKRQERVAQVEAKIDGLCHRVPALGEVPQG
jgi:hypothetical protein